ncbi:MAG: cytochrome C oxidase subunit II [Pseudomonadota bacterium]|jgi:cytochrome c oxidase subunit 2
MATIHIDPLEKRWIWVVGGIVGLTIGIQVFYAATAAIHPPSNVEVIDSAKLHLGSEFAEDKLGVKKEADGSYTVTMVAARYGFYPQSIEVPANTPVKLRIASLDVLHGLHVPYSNMNVMVVPGYVSEVHTQFTNAGDFPMICNEYCGLGHDYMYAKVHVTGGKS